MIEERAESRARKHLLEIELRLDARDLLEVRVDRTGRQSRARREHAAAAKALLDAMAERGQIAGFKAREDAISRVHAELSAAP